MLMRLLLAFAFVATVGLAVAEDSSAASDASSNVRPPSISAVNSVPSVPSLVSSATTGSSGDILENRPLPSVLYAIDTQDEELDKTASTENVSSPTEITTAAASAAPAVVPGTEHLTADELFSHARELYNSHNFADAFPLYRQAANMGHVESQYMTGLMLYRGEGVAIADTKEAARYYQMAADKGFAKAEYNLAVLYYDGAGVARDDTQAYKWLYLSSLQGEPRALKMLPVAQRNLKEDQKASAVAQADQMIRQ